MAKILHCFGCYDPDACVGIGASTRHCSDCVLDERCEGIMPQSCASSFVENLAAWPNCLTPDCPNKICVRFQNGKCWPCTMGMAAHWYDGFTRQRREQISRQTEEEYWRKRSPEAHG